MSTAVEDADGLGLLTSAAVGELLVAACAHGGGTLVSWQLAHVDANPHQSTTATYTAVVDWLFGRRDELLGVSARAGGRGTTDERAVIFADGDREVAVWLYPRDPDLPGLARAAYAEEIAALLTEHRLTDTSVTADQLRLEMIGYRPRRRAVLRAAVSSMDRNGDPVELVYFVKAMREREFAGVRQRHELLSAAGVPAPLIAAVTADCLLVLRELPGRPLSTAIFDPVPPCTAEDLINVLDAMPPMVAQLNRRAPWSDAVAHYAEMVTQALPAEERRLQWMVQHTQVGLAGLPGGDEPTHGDFHEGQLIIQSGVISGILDVDTVGPGRRADDLACLLAHMSTIQRMNAQQAARVQDLLSGWVPVFDTRVDPVELRLRAAAVAISLATGPYRGQEAHWQRETLAILAAAESLMRQVC